MSRLTWTKEEIDILRKYYEYAPVEQLEKLLPRFTIDKIRAKASRLGIKRLAPRSSRKGIKLIRWKEEEILKLQEIYPHTSNDDLREIFQRFDLRKIREKARSLGLEKTKEIKQIDRQNQLKKTLGEKEWSKEEEKILIEHYPKLGQVGIQKLLPHRSISSINTKVSRLGIKKETNAYWERVETTVNKKDIFSIKVVYERMDR